jgi:hypothetical protein
MEKRRKGLIFFLTVLRVFTLQRKNKKRATITTEYFVIREETYFPGVTPRIKSQLADNW